MLFRSSELETPQKLRRIYEGLVSVIDLYQPEAAAIEAIFSHRSSQSALVLGQARGVALLAFGMRNLAVSEYNASTIKNSVAGSGKAEKEQVQLMVKTILRLPDVIRSQDASDALAVAICHATRSGLAAKIGVAR